MPNTESKVLQPKEETARMILSPMSRIIEPKHKHRERVIDKVIQHADRILQKLEDEHLEDLINGLKNRGGGKKKSALDKEAVQLTPWDDVESFMRRGP